MKNGTSLEYPEQIKGGQVSIYSHKIDGENFNNIEISDIMNAQINGSKNSHDTIILNGKSGFNTINVKDGESSGRVVSDDRVYLGEDTHANKVIKDANDELHDQGTSNY